MRNLDLFDTKLENERKQLFEAMNSSDEAKQKEAFNNWATSLQNLMIETANSKLELMQNEKNDEAILARRSLRRELTSEENRFFNKAVEARKIEGLDVAFPKTIIEDVYRNLATDHPLLSLVDMQPGTVKGEYIYGDATTKKAFWGKLPADIKEILLDAFKHLDISQSKLSGFVAVPKSYFELGPTWLANYVVTFLREVMSATLEEAIINGDGKDKPLGMMRKLSGDSGGVYPAKDKVTLSDITPTTLAGVRAALSKNKTDNGSVVVLVNPTTYWAKLYPKLAYKTPEGAWITTQLPTGEEIITSHAVPVDTLIFGVLKNYLFVYNGDVDIKEYKDTLAIEDLDLYIAKFFGKGISKNSNAFFVCDISSIQGATIADSETEAAIKPEDTINPS